MAIDDFALGHALGAAPEMEVKAERLAAHSRHWVMPCLWAAGGDFDAFDGALESDPTVDDVITTRNYDNESFYQIDWAEEIKQHLDITLDSEASLLHAETVDDDWRLAIRFASRDQFEIFRDHLADAGIAFRLDNLAQATVPKQFAGGLTAPQREALVTAVAEGYFAIPRDANMEDVADALDISTQSASERLRRGIEEFVETRLVTDDDVLEE
ncbi:helix-turn-helix domain-containing protein [Halovivax limisalsi]|uniref:helix-turn-helix domain-containing protein n=1 Tax=Halovivax limisalsi TaxID=1453760 RepID=UPI001FFCAF89|nr:helix-turn-helix domain-containing protein [Halovivax limisalsi]